MRYLFVLLLVACSPANPYQDLGVACLDGYEVLGSDVDGNAASVEVELVVTLSDCSSGSVDWRDQQCDVEVGDGFLEVSTSGKRKSPWQGGTDDCNIIEQSCGTVQLDAGEWLFLYGDGEVAFDVPYDIDRPCVAADGSEVDDD